MRRFLGTARRRVGRLPYLAPVLFWMSVVELAVRFVPLPRISAFMGVPLRSTDDSSAVTRRPLTLTRWQSGQLRALRPVARRWPFADGPCLRQSLVAGHILRRLDPVLRLGIATDDTKLLAHAWVEVGGILLGESSDYAPLVDEQPG